MFASETENQLCQIHSLVVWSWCPIAVVLAAAATIIPASEAVCSEHKICVVRFTTLFHEMFLFCFMRCFTACSVSFHCMFHKMFYNSFHTCRPPHCGSWRPCRSSYQTTSRQPGILRRRSHSVEQLAVRHSNCFFCDNFQESTQDSFIYPVILYNIISSVRCSTVPL